MEPVIAAALFGTIVAGSVQAQSYQPSFNTLATGPQPSGGCPSWDQARFGHYRRTLEAVRSEALKLQASDGGRLTPEHIGYLQGKIDAAQRELAYETDGRSLLLFAHSAPR